jgi:hypothetical protein
MQQPELFTNAVTPSPIVTPADRRSDAMQAALDKAGEDFRNDYRAFVIDYASKHDRFTNEQIAEAYRQTALTQPHDWRASGGIIKSLKRSGQLVGVDFTFSKTRCAPIEVFARGKR